MTNYFIFLGRGIGQVMFQNNALAGALMLIGILLNSWQMALLAVAGNAVGMLAAYVSGYSRDDMANGLYGFNGTLVGIAIGVFMPVNLYSLLLLVAGSCLSTWIARAFAAQRVLPGFTAPFIISVWVLLAGVPAVVAVLAGAVRSGGCRTGPPVPAGFQYEYRAGDVSRRHCAVGTVLSARNTC